MTKCFRAFNGKVAIWEKPDSTDPEVIMDPFFNPADHMDEVYFHSDLQYLANVLQADVTVTHTALAGLTGSGVLGAPSLGGSAQPIANGDTRGLSIDLLTHDFGYPPIAFVMYEDEIVSGATVVQNEAGGGRLVSSWSSNTKVGIWETAISGTSTLPAVDRTYRVMCFRQLSGDSTLPTLHIKPGEGIIVLGKKITQDARPLRVPANPGDAEFFVPLVSTIDARNGALRSISPISGTVDLGFYTGSFFELKSVLMSNS